MIKDGSTIYANTKINFRSLFTKPLKFVIQFFTSSIFEHTLFCVDGKVLEINGDDTKFTSFDSWLEGNAEEYVKFSCKELIHNLSEDEKAHIISYCESQVGVKYSAYQASMSWLDDVFAVFKKDSSFNRYCSGQVFNCYVAMGIFPKENESLTPRELLSYQSKSGKFNKIKRINAHKTP